MLKIFYSFVPKARYDRMAKVQYVAEWIKYCDKIANNQFLSNQIKHVTGVSKNEKIFVKTS